ncbi:hypothetical protein D8674_020686 [Pyrus ussuriensis x Pyrus communis]|uniref:Uncharacterized protein n=1 Tax=Pyrus ussuriensis x Pyrus communis TaxID=2448454 RepID=A0A5N5HHE7_9ROSA|nr:hypothetical protein D8674_020686 [Pyrus ussuriensis x Pyrus communis]
MSFNGHIIKESKALLAEVTGASVTHRLARDTLSSSYDCSWFEEPPDIITDVLYFESCN